MTGSSKATPDSLRCRQKAAFSCMLKTIAREEMSDKRMLLFVVPVHVNAGKVVNAHIHMHCYECKELS